MTETINLLTRKNVDVGARITGLENENKQLRQELSTLRTSLEQVLTFVTAETKQTFEQMRVDVATLMTSTREAFGSNRTSVEEIQEHLRRALRLLRTRPNICPGRLESPCPQDPRGSRDTMSLIPTVAELLEWWPNRASVQERRMELLKCRSDRI